MERGTKTHKFFFLLFSHSILRKEPWTNVNIKKKIKKIFYPPTHPKKRKFYGNVDYENLKKKLQSKFKINTKKTKSTFTQPPTNEKIMFFKNLDICSWLLIHGQKVLIFDNWHFLIMNYSKLRHFFFIIKKPICAFLFLFPKC